jgi:tetratricopeptide (TPR) repeat protein
MKKHWIEYSQQWQPSSMSYWVHVETDGRSWFTATSFDPPLPTMNEQKSFDEQGAHRRFAAQCFNRAWDLIEKSDRTEEDDREMLRLAHASHWHWTQVKDHTPQNVSIAYWQTARIYTLLGDAEHAKRYADLCLEVSRANGIEPFYLGYAYEAMSRAASIAGDGDSSVKYRDEAARIAATVSDEDSRRQLEQDLDTIE